MNELLFYGTDELMHSGKKGMKWGVRRYQNKDGSLTPAGKKRYARDARERDYDNYDEETSTYYKTTKKGRDVLKVDANKYVKEDLTRTKKLAEETAGLTNKLKQQNDTAIKNAPKAKMDLSKMSDKEMRDAINRAFLEKQYNDMFAPQTVNRGREQVGKILESTTNVLAIGTSALGIALAIKELRG